MFRFAHISDPHVMPLPAVAPWRLANKRFLGYLSWQRKRRWEHRPEVLDALRADLADQNPAHICVTGDLTNLSLAEEFEAAAAWLRGLGTADRVTVIPGNHDAYVPGALGNGLKLLAPWMADDDDGKADFPFIHRRGPVDFIGASSAVATMPGLASGRLGRGQRDRLRRILSSPSEHGRLRVLLIHHPPHRQGTSARKALRDDIGLQNILSQSDVSLVLHGHGHHPDMSELAGGGAAIPVLGAGSASAVGRHRDPGHYYVIEFDPDKDAGQILVRNRHFNADLGRFTAGGEQRIKRPASNGRPDSAGR